MDADNNKSFDPCFPLIIAAVMLAVAMVAMYPKPQREQRWTHCPSCNADLRQGFTEAIDLGGNHRWQQCYKCDWQGPKSVRP